jgi:hypothetical protein
MRVAPLYAELTISPRYHCFSSLGERQKLHDFFIRSVLPIRCATAKLRAQPALLRAQKGRQYENSDLQGNPRRCDFFHGPVRFGQGTKR